MDSPKMLCAIEDDPDMQLLIRAMLRSDPRIQIAIEPDCLEDALTEITRCQPDLIILDHFIYGDVMGLQAAPLLRQCAPNSKILLFTSHDLVIEVEREPAIDFYLHKHDLSNLLPVIQNMLFPAL